MEQAVTIFGIVLFGAFASFALSVVVGRALRDRSTRDASRLANDDASPLEKRRP
jgi:hypothetical protein